MREEIQYSKTTTFVNSLRSSVVNRINKNIFLQSIFFIVLMVLFNLIIVQKAEIFFSSFVVIERICDLISVPMMFFFLLLPSDKMPLHVRLIDVDKEGRLVGLGALIN